MSCNCRDDIEKKLLDRFKAQQLDATEHLVTLAGYTFVIVDGDMVETGYMPFALEAVYSLKNGKTKRKTSRHNMIFSYCPFCGERYPLKQEAKAAA